MIFQGMPVNRKNTLARIVAAAALVIILAGWVRDSSADTGAARGEDAALADSVGSGWSKFSWGLYYKHGALAARGSKERKALLEKAIEWFTRADASGEARGEIQLQLADCYFYRREYGKALDHARRALAEGESDLRVYNRLYNSHLRLRDNEAAAGVLLDYLRIRPGSVQILFILAEHYQKKMRDPERAALTYRKVIEISDSQPVDDYYKEQSYFNLAVIAYQSGKLDEAVSLYGETLNVNRENLEALYYLALTCMEKYDIDCALRHAELFLAKQPDDPVINSVLGRVYYIRGDLRAISYLGKAGDADSLSGLLSRGLYSELAGDDRAAEEDLGRVMKIAPATITLRLALGRINERKGDRTAAFNEYVTAGVLMYNNRLYDEAKRCLLDAARLNDSVAGVYYYLAKIHEDTRGISRALYYYIRANRIQEDTDLMLHIGYLYGVRREYDRALDYITAASAKEPKNARPYFFKGLISIWREDYPSAERHLERAISFDDTSETYYFYFAVVMDKLSRVDRAIDSLEKAIAHDPKSGRAYNYLGYLFADRNMNLDRSLELIRKALELEPDNGAYIDSLGWVYFRRGEYALALQNLLAAEKILRRAETPDPVVYDHIGDAYLKMGKIRDAIINWEKSNEMKRDESIRKKIRTHREKRQ